MLARGLAVVVVVVVVVDVTASDDVNACVRSAAGVVVVVGNVAAG